MKSLRSHQREGRPDGDGTCRASLGSTLTEAQQHHRSARHRNHHETNGNGAIKTTRLQHILFAEEPRVSSWVKLYLIPNHSSSTSISPPTSTFSDDMAFIFTCGTHTFTSLLDGYQNITCQCQNCGNWSGRVYKRWEWFTFCFVVCIPWVMYGEEWKTERHTQPIIPFSLKPWHEVGCHICNFYQDIRSVCHASVVISMMNVGAKLFWVADIGRTWSR